MYSAFVFPLSNYAILRHCIKWWNHNRLRRQERAGCSVTLCCHCVCDEAHRDMWRYSSFRKAATGLGFEPCTPLFTLRTALFHWIPLYGSCKWWWHFCSWFGSSVMWRSIARWVLVGVSNSCNSFIFRVNNPRDSWRCRHYDASKRREIHGVTLQKTQILSSTAVRTCFHVLDVLQVSVHCVLAEWQQGQFLFVCLFVCLFERQVPAYVTFSVTIKSPDSICKCHYVTTETVLTSRVTLCNVHSST